MLMNKHKFHYAYSVVFSCFILQMVMLVGLQSVPLMLGDIAQSLQISATEAGGLTGAFSLFYGSLGFVWGFISDKIGVRKVLMISLACVTVGLLLFGLFGTSLVSCIALYAVVGIGCAALAAATVPKLMGRWFDVTKRHRPTAICMMGGVFCGALQGIVVPRLVGAFGWNTALIIIAGIVFVLAVIIVLIIRNTPEEKGLHPYGAPEDGDVQKVVSPDKQKVKGLHNFTAVLKMPFTWKQIAHNTFYFIAYNAVNSFLPMAIMSAGYTRAEAGLVVTVYNVFQLIAMFVWGSLSDRIEPKRALSYSLFIWVLGCVALAFAYSSLNTAFFAIAITGLGLAAPGLAMAINADYFPPEITGTGSGITSTVGTIGRTLGPILAGILIDSTGTYISLFIFAAIIMLIASFIPFSYGNVRNKGKDSEAIATGS
jgi:sugar phosphate permease